MLNSNSDYSVVSNTEAAGIINRFTPDMIEDIIDNSLANKFRNYTNQLINIVAVIDQNSKIAMNALPDNSKKIREAAEDNYIYFISNIC